MQAGYININGKLILSANAAVAHDNKAFRYGYGLFETILYRDGEIELKVYHADRLFAGAKLLGFPLPVHMNETWFENEIKRTVKKNKQERLCRVRLQLYPGRGGLYDIQNANPEYVIECFPLNEHIIELNVAGLTLGIAEGLNKSMDSLSNIKSCNALIYAMAARQAKINKWNDALVLNTSDHIIESTIANVFWVKDGIIYTPPLSEGCVGGIMRRKLLKELPVIGYHVVERSLKEELLAGADEVFLTNAIRRIKWVTSVNNAIYSHHLITEISSKLFR